MWAKVITPLLRTKWCFMSIYKATEYSVFLITVHRLGAHINRKSSTSECWLFFFFFQLCGHRDQGWVSPKIIIALKIMVKWLRRHPSLFLASLILENWPWSKLVFVRNLLQRPLVKWSFCFYAPKIWNTLPLPYIHQASAFFLLFFPSPF